MGVPFIDIKRFETGFLEEWEAKVKLLSKDARFIGGDEVANLERSLSEYTSSPHVVSCANGTDAIQLALRAMGVKRGDKVLLPDSTFWATFEAVVNVGATPYTVDTNLQDLQMDFATFAKAVEDIKPQAAILVHLYGWGSADLQKYRDLCQSKNIPLLEDGAQCFGVEYQGKSIYSGAYIATTSFYPAKVLGAAGDAGAVFCSNEDLAKTTRILANHGRNTHYGHGMVGWNSRMDSLQAAFLNIVLKHFEKRLSSRQKVASQYAKDLPEIGVAVVNPPVGYLQNGYCNVTLFPTEKRADLQVKLKEAGIGFANIYPGSMSTQEGAKEYLGGIFGGENAKKISQEVLNLPLFPYMKEEEYQQVLAILSAFMKEQ
ncbi:MAG: DegT/DnrJ/EryC1/StrS family aminotransferase [Spirochaetota bacterium]